MICQHLTTRRAILAASAGVFARAVLPAAPHELCFGVIADVHYGLSPTAHQRLQAFIEDAQERSLDFIVHLGDFCHARPESNEFLRTWQSFRGPRYHVLGNHEMDFGTKAKIQDYWGMPRNYYSFDHRGFHFVVLDCNYLNFDGRFVDFANSNYFGTGRRRDWVNPEQIEWLRADLRAASGPTVVFTHQGVGDFWIPGATANRANVKNALAEANREAGWQKAIACMSGHHHADHLALADGINYLMVNSASYYWVGETYGSMAHYRDPLWAVVTLDPRGQIRIKGRKSDFIPPTPTELKHPDAPNITPSIIDRVLQFTPASGRQVR